MVAVHVPLLVFFFFFFDLTRVSSQVRPESRKRIQEVIASLRFALVSFVAHFCLLYFVPTLLEASRGFYLGFSFS